MDKINFRIIKDTLWPDHAIVHGRDLLSDEDRAALIRPDTKEVQGIKIRRFKINGHKIK